MAHGAKLFNKQLQYNSLSNNERYHVSLRTTHTDAMNQYHTNKSNQSLTQGHTGLSGAWWKVTQQTVLVQLSKITPTYMAKGYTISTQKLTIGNQSHRLRNCSNTRYDPEVQYVPLRPTFYFFGKSLTLYHIGLARCCTQSKFQIMASNFKITNQPTALL